MLFINKTLIQKRKELGVSQVKLAQLSGVSLPTIQNIEAGKSNLSLALLEKLLLALNLRIQIFSQQIDWTKAIQLGIPITTDKSLKKISIKDYQNELDIFLNSLPVNKIEYGEDARAWEALTSYLWAFHDHYPKVFKSLTSYKKTKKILDFNLKNLEVSRLIKLRRISLATLSSIL